MIDLILVASTVLCAAGFLFWRAVQKPKHGCPDCEVSKVRPKQSGHLKPLK